jgi:hypothetical protein
MAVVAAATAVLPLRAAAVGMKSPAATVMAGAHTKINNQLKSATATADGSNGSSGNGDGGGVGDSNGGATDNNQVDRQKRRRLCSWATASAS